jgi:hypothetical protein
MLTTMLIGIAVSLVAGFTVFQKIERGFADII